jgi:lactoylglutathione lyase/glyoxylase I family protein
LSCRGAEEFVFDANGRSPDEQLAYLAPSHDDDFMVELVGGGDPLPLNKPAYTDLGDSLHYSTTTTSASWSRDIQATVDELRRRGVTIVAEPFQLDAIGRNLAFFADPFGDLTELTEVLV